MSQEKQSLYRKKKVKLRCAMSTNTLAFKVFNLYNYVNMLTGKPLFIIQFMHLIHLGCYLLNSQKSQNRWSRTGGGSCRPDHRRAARLKASPETWRGSCQNEQWQAMSERWSPSTAG